MVPSYIYLCLSHTQLKEGVERVREQEYLSLSRHIILTMSIYQKSQMHVLFGPVISLLEIYLTLTTLVQNYVCTRGFIVALFITTTDWKQCSKYTDRVKKQIIV